MEVERLRRELYEEQNLNVNQLGDLTEELAEAKEDLEQERNSTCCGKCKILGDRIPRTKRNNRHIERSHRLYLGGTLLSEIL